MHTREQDLACAADHTSQRDKYTRNRKVHIVEQEMDDECEGEGDDHLEPGKGKHNEMIYVCL